MTRGALVVVLLLGMSIPIATYAEEASEGAATAKKEPTRQDRIGACSVDHDATFLESDRKLFGWEVGKTLEHNVDIGSTVSVQLVRYTFKTKKASIASPGVGGGLTFRYYPDEWITPIDKTRDIRRIRSSCRGITAKSTWIEDDYTNGSLALPLVSASFVGFVSKDEKEADATVQPAMVFGFFRELLQLGVGFNLTGDLRGKPFLLLGLGVGLN